MAGIRFTAAPRFATIVRLRRKFDWLCELDYKPKVSIVQKSHPF
jgi:hypothetical protein